MTYSPNNNRICPFSEFIEGTTVGISTRTLAFWSAGSQVSSVPEPENFALMFAALSLFGFVSRRRKQRAAN